MTHDASKTACREAKKVSRWSAPKEPLKRAYGGTQNGLTGLPDAPRWPRRVLDGPRALSDSPIPPENGPRGRQDGQRQPLKSMPRDQKFAGPTGQRRAKISGHCLTVFFFARAGRSLGVPGRTAPQSSPGQVPAGSDQRWFSVWAPPSRLSREHQKGPRGHQEASKIVHEGSEMSQDRSKTPTMAPRRPKRPPRRALPRGKIYCIPVGFGKILWFPSFRLPDAPGESKMPPRASHEGPRGPPRGPQDSPRGLQDGPREPQ